MISDLPVSYHSFISFVPFIPGAPCESVAILFQPKKNEDWVRKSRMYSIDYTSEYDKYAAVYKKMDKRLKK